MSTGTLNTGQVSIAYTPTENDHALRQTEYLNGNVTETVSLSSAVTEGSVSLAARIFAMRIDVDLATHTAPYTAKLCVLEANTDYRGPVLLKVVASDENPTFQLYDDAAYSNQIFEIGAFDSAGETVAVLLFPNGTDFDIKA